MPVGNPVTDLSGPGNYVPVTRTLTINGVTYDLSANRTWTVGVGSVSSVGLIMPTGFSVSNSPITSSGDLTVGFAAGYSLPTTAKQSQWDSAYSFTSTFPTGSAFQLLRYNTLGTALEFFTPSYLTPADIIATTPLVWNSGTKTISIPVANNTTDGYLSSADWLTFSSKQPAITLTTTGNNGASTLIGATLNVPEYTLVGLGGLANPFSAAIGQLIYSNSAGAGLSLSGNTSTTKKFLSQTGDGVNSDAPFWSTISISDVSGAISLTALSASSPLLYNNTTGVFSIQVATSSQNGYLSSTDWLTFSSKQGAITLTTTGNNGSASLIGNTLNIPTYTISGLGGLTNPFSAAIGQLIYSNSAGTPLSLSPNVTTTKMFLSQTGDGTNSNAPVWEAITTLSIGAVPTSRQLTINGTAYDLSADRSWSVGTVTSIGVSMPTGFSVASSPVTSSGTIAITFASGYSLPTTTKQSEWDSAYTNRITSLTTTGNSGAATLIANTLNIPEYTLAGLGGMTNPMTGANGIGDIIYGNAFGNPTRRAPNVTTTKMFLSSTGDGTSGNAPIWEQILPSTIGAVPTSRQLTINGTAFDLTADRTWSVGTITSLTGEATASGTGAVAVTLTNSAVIGKVLTGLNVTGGTVIATDTILTAFGKLQNQVNGLAGGVTYQGGWNASTNSPALSSGTGTKGYYYVVTTAGSTNLDGITDWKLGDWAIYNGTVWEKVDNTDSVTSVNGFTGAVSLTTANISEATNLYYTDTRSRLAVSLTTTGSSGAATYNNTTGVFNIPQYTLTGLGGVPSSRQLTINGVNFDLTADRSWSVGTVTSVGLSTTTTGVTIGSTPVTTSGTITIDIDTASSTLTGLLSSTDWTNFNGKLNNPFLALGDLVYSNSAGIGVRRSGNITTTKMYLSQTGDGTNSAAPQWSAITASDVGAVPTTRTLTINDVPFNLSADRSWSVGDYGTW